MLYNLVEQINELLKESDGGFKELSYDQQATIRAIISEKVPELDGVRVDKSAEVTYNKTSTILGLYSSKHGQFKMIIGADQIAITGDDFYVSYKTNPISHVETQYQETMKKLHDDGDFEIFSYIYYHGYDLVYVRKNEEYPFKVQISIFINGWNDDLYDNVQDRVTNLIPEIKQSYTCIFNSKVDTRFSIQTSNPQVFNNNIVVTEYSGNTLFGWRLFCSTLIDSYRSKYIDSLVPKAHYH